MRYRTFAWPTASELVSLIETRYADFIKASGHKHRANRPDT